MFCHGVTRFLHHYPYIISVCLTLTQMHLPQSLPLHRINGFARFFHGFISVLLLHSGHTSKPQFFHCFSIVSRVLYTITIFPLFFHPINFHPFTFILLGIIFQAFYSNVPFFSHCFMSYSLIFSIVFLIIFPSIAISPSPPRRADQGESIPQRHPIATSYITLKKFACGHLFYHLL